MATDIFLKLGDKIKGESIDAEHKDKIDVLAWSWGASQSGTTHMGTGGGSGKVSIQDLNFTKYVDISTADILKALSSGDHIPNATLYVRKAGGTKPLTYYQIDMEEVLVSSYSTGSSTGDDRFTENISLNVARFRITYKRQDEKGGQAGQVQAGWDIPKNEAW
ncbi:MAG: type VI secretion system tube protein Hcp [Gemmobacter sp.]